MYSFIKVWQINELWNLNLISYGSLRAVRLSVVGVVTICGVHFFSSHLAFHCQSAADTSEKFHPKIKLVKVGDEEKEVDKQRTSTPLSFHFYLFLFFFFLVFCLIINLCCLQ